MVIVQQEVSVGRCLSILYRHAQAQISKQLNAFGIGSGQYPVLLVLETNNGIMQETISSTLQMDKATVARAIAKLEKEGLIRRQGDSQDKRVWLIYLTDKGTAVLPEIKKVLVKWSELITTGLSQTEKSTVTGILQKMAGNAGQLELRGPKGEKN